MREKIITKRALIVFCVISFWFISTSVYTVAPPTCAISFSPATITQGEVSNYHFEVTGPVDKVIYKWDGVLSYMGNELIEDLSSLASDSLQYQDREGFERGYQIKPMSIGVGSEVIKVYGPGGSNTCSASIKVLSKSLAEESKEIISFDLVGNELLHSCASFDCPVTQYGTLDGIVEIKDKSGEWYKVKITERGVWNKDIGDYGGTQRLPESMWTTTEGWFHESLIPENVKQAFIDSQQKEQAPQIEEKQIPAEETRSEFIPLLSFFQNKNFQTSFIITFVFIILLLSIILLRKKIKVLFKLKWSEVNLQKIKSKRKSFAISTLVAIGTMIGIIGISYGAVYYQTSQLIRKTEQLTKAEKYNEAIGKLEFAQNRWVTKNLGLKSQEINLGIEQNKKLIDDKLDYAQGIEEFNKDNWEKAKELLSKVSDKSPYYQDAKNKIDEAQNSIVKEQIGEAVEKVTEETKKITEEAQRQNAELEQKITELQQKQQPSSQPIISTSLSSSDINKIISSVVYVVCAADYFTLYINEGSGTVWKFSEDPNYFVLTNAHMVSTTDRSSSRCVILFPTLPSGTPYYLYNTTFDRMDYTGGRDWALLKLTTPSKSQYTLNQIPLFSDYPMCNFSDVNIGDKVTIFGYPSVGGENITVTEGNISGFSGNDYKVSSGVIDKGNSGGAAILNKAKCSLGIPTWVSIGVASSVGIIQSWRTIYNDFSK